MDVHQNAPIRRLLSRFRVNASERLLAIITINAAVIGVSVITYEVRKVVILWNRNLPMDTDKIRKISETKQLVFRNLFSFSRTWPIWACMPRRPRPPTCLSETGSLPRWKTRILFEVPKTRLKHKIPRCKVQSVVSTAYIATLPSSSFIPLWRKWRTIRATIGEDKTFEDPGCGLISGLRFRLENYELRAWYWGLVEISCFYIWSDFCWTREQVILWLSIGYCRNAWNAFLLDQIHTRRDRKQPCCYCHQPWRARVSRASSKD